ncbi:arginine deiminase family protein [Conexibacter stalactiti]|uniref:Arginine deiminase family protein n=1 Tax=Conexibacter stalactiti TaxID=1940611 RepID=A0ABU4HJF8_9ACTN|nr:arginine deiminase family protein [Conexibacter stalactiti]MDW5593397.1 arginine deiminase family protein [Conexibacter stalactiti]MEC5034038.1 arginine deiminase family protein [Conexibacter stalactiti]
MDHTLGYAALPAGYHQLLTPPEAEPPFDDAGELAAVWGERWGASDEVGQLREVLVRTPGDELGAVRADAYQPSLDALVDPAGGWYWTGAEPPSLSRVHAQHRGLVETLEREGVVVHAATPLHPRYTKSVYVRDPLVTIRGGAIVGRLAPRMRRGEEAAITREVAARGLPILGTIVGNATLEGGSFAKLRPGLAAFGTSVRCNDAGAAQLRELLARFGWELIVVPLPGFVVHLDIHFAMVDVDRALVNAEGLPYTFLDDLRRRGIETIWAHPQEPWALNLLTLSPGRVLTSESAPRTAELLAARGIEVVTIPYDELHKNGGGIHCSTMELLRDDAA